MRQDPLDVQQAIAATSKNPRFVVGIIYPTSSPYFTSKAGLTNVPGVPVQGVLHGINGTTQEINPDEGRSTIGSISFSVVDNSSDMTDELRSQLDSNDRGPRKREVRMFMGFTDDFNDYVRIATQQLDDVKLQNNVYQITCADIQREMRAKIFQQVKTRLTADLTAAATTITVNDTTGFETMAHTGSFSDAPDATVGYFTVKKTKEIIRYTGTTATTFTGCTRGVFGTVATALDIDTTKQIDKQPEIEEFVYLEMPGPELAYAVVTGVIRSSTASPQDTLPTAWHLGIDETLVDGAAFDNIGLDLVDATDDTAGLVFRFSHMKAADGKAFLERQLMLPMGTFMPINIDGVLGLRKFARILTDAPQMVDLDETNVVTVSALHHDQRSVINQIQIDWNHDGEDFTRRTFVQDNNSINRNGAATVKAFQLRGLSVALHTDRTIDRIVRTLSDRYGEPPERLEVRVLPSLSALEVGDTVRVALSRFRDYQDTGTLDRTFEIQQTQIDWITGRVTLRLFGTGREVAAEAPSGSAVPMPDAWYPSEGTNLTTPLTISGDAVTANGTLTGNADLNAAGAIFYYDGNLTINAGVVVTIHDNVQLRIKGTLTINGDIDGLGNGIGGLVSQNTVGVAVSIDINDYLGLSGYIGTTRGGDGVYWNAVHSRFQQRNAAISSQGIHNAAPVLDIEVTGTLDSPVSAVLHGIPTDLRGTSGPPGYPALDSDFTVEWDGGDGGDSGAGLLIVCRGLAFGASGGIDTSGAVGGTGGQGALGPSTIQGGGGAGGAPGALYVLLDGDGVTYPDLSGKFTGSRGASGATGTPWELQSPWLVEGATPGMGAVQDFGADIHADSSHQIQYIPTEADATDGEDDVVPVLQNFTVTGDDEGVIVSWDPLSDDSYDSIEVFSAISSGGNDRSNSVLRWSGKGSIAYIQVQGIFSRYYWARVRRAGKAGDWTPLSSTAGLLASGGREVIPIVGGDVFTETFDDYASLDDFAKNWEIITEPDDVTFPQTGRFGGRVIDVTKGELYAVSKKLIPFDPNRMYFGQLEFQHIANGSVGQEGCLIGMIPVLADGVTKVDINGADNFTNPHVLASEAMNGFTTDEWFRMWGWFGRSLDSGSFVDYATINGERQHETWDVQQLRQSNDSPPQIPAFFRPYIVISQGTTPVSGANANTQVDNVVLKFWPGPLVTSLPDPSLTEPDDFYWESVDYAIGEGEYGNNALKYPNVSNVTLGSRTSHMLRRSGDTLIVKWRYKVVDNNSPTSIDAGSNIRAIVFGYHPDSTHQLRYVSSGQSANGTAHAFSTLTTDGTWNEVTHTIDISGMDESDGLVVLTSIFSNSAGDDFDFFISRHTDMQVD